MGLQQKGVILTEKKLFGLADRLTEISGLGVLGKTCTDGRPTEVSSLGVLGKTSTNGILSLVNKIKPSVIAKRRKKKRKDGTLWPQKNSVQTERTRWRKCNNI